MHFPTKKVTINEFLGWHMGDGCISVNDRYSEFALTGDIIEEAEFYENTVIPSFNLLFKGQLRKTIELKKYKSTGVCGIFLFNKVFVFYLIDNYRLSSGKKTKIVLNHNLKTKKDKVEFLRGVFDTDGSIYFCKSNYKTVNPSVFRKFHYKPKIKIAMISEDLIIQIKGFLEDIGFMPRYSIYNSKKLNELPVHNLVLDLKKDIEKWLDTIGFRNPKHQTKVKIWEKYGFCPPKTTIAERKIILDEKNHVLNYYPEHKNMHLEEIMKALRNNDIKH